MSVVYLTKHQQVAQAVNVAYRAKIIYQKAVDEAWVETMRRLNPSLKPREGEPLEEAARRMGGKAIPKNYNLQFVIIIWGDVGIGKTSLVNQMCQQWNEQSTEDITYYEMPLSNYMKEDFAGYPMPNKETKRMEFYPIDNLPFANEWGVVCFDDLDRCPPDVQNAAKAFLSGQTVNGLRMSPNAYLIGTANGMGDAGGTSPLNDAFLNRCIHIYLRPDASAIEWLGDRTQELAEAYSVREHTDYEEIAKDTLRSRDMSRWLMAAFRDEPLAVRNALLSGCVGSHMAEKLLMLSSRRVSLDDIAADPGRARVDVLVSDFHLLAQEIEKLAKGRGGHTALRIHTPAIEEWLARLPDSDDENREMIRGILKTAARKR